MRNETLETIKNRFYKELRFSYVDEIITEERVLKELKHLYIKHAFDAMGSKFGEMYRLQYEFVQKLKKEYAVKYAQ